MRAVRFLIYIAAITVLWSCSQVTGNDPNVVLQEFFEQLAKKDIDRASRYVTKDSKGTMDMMKKGLSMAETMKDSLPSNDPMKDFEDVIFEPARIMGDSAFIIVRSKSRKRPDAEFKLLKESSGWKVDFTMSTLMKMGAESLNNNADDTIKMNNEELEKGMQMADSVLKNVDPRIVEQLQQKLENVK